MALAKVAANLKKKLTVVPHKRIQQGQRRQFQGPLVLAEKGCQGKNTLTQYWTEVYAQGRSA